MFDFWIKMKLKNGTMDNFGILEKLKIEQWKHGKVWNCGKNGKI